MRTKEFVGPDGKIYSEHTPEEGSFLTYFGGSRWLIAFPINDRLDQNYYFWGDHLPVGAEEWRILNFGKHQSFPANFEIAEGMRSRIGQDSPLGCSTYG